MGADEALKQSKDGIIYFNERWDSGGVGSLPRIFAEGWQPSRPVELCEACKEADMTDEKTGMRTLETDHLRKWHCVCKKEA